MKASVPNHGTQQKQRSIDQNFLQEDLAVSVPSITMALRRCEQTLGPLPVILWQYGLVSLGQLEQIFDWLESRLETD